MVDGTTDALGVTYTPASPDARLLGTPVATAAGSAVGAQAITVSGAYSNQRGYDITLVPGTLTITAAVVPPAPQPEPQPPLSVTTPSVITVTDPGPPITVGPDAGGASIVLPGTGTTPVQLQNTVNGQPLTVAALPGTLLHVTRVNGQSVLVLVVLQGWASMESSTAGQPMVLAGDVVLSSGAAGTRIEAQRLAVAVVSGALVPPQGSLPQLGAKGLLAGERLLVDASGKLEGISLGSLKGDAQLPGDAMAFANLPPAISVDGKAFARLAGPVTRLAGASVAQGLEVAPTGVILLRADGAIYQLLPVQPIAIDATQPDGLAFTPLGLLRWVRGGVVVQFAPAVADLAGLATAVAAKWPEAKIKLMAEGVLRLSLGGQTHVLRPEWTGAGSTTTGTPQVELEEGSLRFGAGNGPVQWLLPALLSHTQAHRARGPSPSPWPARCGAWCRRGCCQRRPVARHRRPMKTGGQEAMECCTCGWGPGAGRARYRLRGLREAWSGGRALAVTERCWSVS